MTEDPGFILTITVFTPDRRHIFFGKHFVKILTEAFRLFAAYLLICLDMAFLTHQIHEGVCQDC